MENVDHNKMIDSNEDPEEYEFKYNFINTPWDDRTKRSKIGIVILLVSIFTATMASVITNFVMHYRGYKGTKIVNNNEINCHLVKMDDYRYVARIHLVSGQELLCVGAVVSKTSILANGACVKSGPIRLRLGNPTDPRCKKGFSVDVIEPIHHDSVISKRLVLLTSYENILDCTSVIHIGDQIDFSHRAYIIGRPLHLGRALTRQPVSLLKKDYKLTGIRQLNKNNMICVQDLARCPVRAGDLLIQNGRLYGLASTSVHDRGEYKVACFANISLVRKEMKEFDPDIV